jgi:uncharacterized protein involved in exopolysaccharide biosynthesis
MEKTMEEDKFELNVHQIGHRLLHGWRLILGLGLLGTLIGFGFSLLRAPIYEAKAVLGVNIIYGVSEELALVVEDRALSRVATLVLADATLEKTLGEIADNIRETRGWEESADLRASLRLERRLAEWDLVVVDPDPQIAAQVAQSWAEVTLDNFEEAVKHAWNASRLLAGGKFVVDCEEMWEDGEPIDVWQCVAVPNNVVEEHLSEELQAEIEMSQGVLPNISYELLQSASPPTEPILWHRAGILLSGAIVGMIAGSMLSLGPRDLLQLKKGYSDRED